MQNKSEQLCKLLNLKPVYSMWINIGDLDNNYVKVTDKRYYKLISDNRWHIDFYNPENFVKLQGMYQYYLNNDLIIDKFSRNYLEDFNINTYIDQKLDKAMEIYRWANATLRVYNKDFLKAIQETKWAY